MIIEPREVWLKDGEKLILRSSLADDAPTMLTFLKQLTDESYRNMNMPKGAWDDVSTEKEAEILQRFNGAAQDFMVSAFTRAGRIVGNLGASTVSTSPFLKHSLSIGMGCVEEYQGRGLGNQLLRTAIFAAEKNKTHRLQLSVRTYNKAGIALYEKCGFQKIGVAHEIALIDGEYVDELNYELILR